MKKVSKILCGLMLVFTMFSGLCTPVFAGTNDSAGVGSGSGGSGGGNVAWGFGPSYSKYGLQWETFKGSKTLKTDMGWKAYDRTLNLSNTNKGAYLKLYSNKAKRWTWHNWKYWDECMGGAPSRIDWWYGGKGLYQSKGHGKLPDAELIAEAINSGFSYNTSQKWYKKGNQKLDAVWITVTWTQKSEVKTEQSIVYAEQDGNVLIDRRNESAQSIYSSPTKSLPYGGKTKANQYNYSSNIKASYTTITKKTTWKQDQNGNKKDVVTTYSKGGTTSSSRDITYKVTQPGVSQTYFKPYDLNRNGVATDSDVKSTYPEYNGGSPLKMSVDNKQGITNGSALKTLDTNTSLPFSIKFQNGQFGIPTASEGGFNLADNAPGGVYKNSDGSYNSGVIGAIGSAGTANTGQFWSSGMSTQNVSGNISKDSYWAGSMKANLSANTASLTYGNTEKIGGDAFSFGKVWQGGDFIFKTTKIGTYKLTNSGRSWWEMQYEKGKFYGYGIEYKGMINIGNIGQPSITHTNLYAGLASKNMVQPIVKGTFESKTVGGNIG